MDAVQKALRVAKQVGGGAAGAAGTAGGAAPDYTSFVSGLYQSELGRAPDPAGLQGWVDALQSNKLTQEQVKQGFAQSPEAQIGGVYKEVLGRPVDAGAAGWAQALQSGQMSLPEIRTAVSQSPEAVVTNLYQELLNRRPDANAATWAEALQSGKMTPEQIRQNIIGSQEYMARNPAAKTTSGTTTSGGTTSSGVTPVDITKQGMPLVYRPAPYKDYGATAAAYRVASGLENLPAPFYTLSPVVGGTPAPSQTNTYQNVLNEVLKGGGAGGAGGGGAGGGGGGGKAVADRTADIGNLYKKYLGRDATPQEAANWMSVISSGQGTYDDVLAGIANSAEETVRSTYKTMLDREPDAAASAWSAALSSGQMTPQKFQAAVQSSPEYIQNQLTKAYQGYLNRAPEEAGLAGWKQAIQSGDLTVNQALAGIAQSPEAQARSNDIISQTYQTYLGRAPDAAAAEWKRLLDSGKITTDQFIQGVAQSPEAIFKARGYQSGGAVEGYADGGMTDDQYDPQLRQIFKDIMKRDIDEPGYKGFMDALSEGKLTLSDLPAQLRASSEYVSQNPYDALVRSAYSSFLGREADPAGYKGWIEALQTGKIKPQDFEQSFKGAGYEDDIYQNYRDLLGRAPDPEGYKVWGEALQSGKLTPEQFRQQLMASPEYVVKQNVPTPDIYSERQGGRQYKIDIGNVERMPELERIQGPINVKQKFEDSTIAKLTQDLAAANARADAAAAQAANSRDTSTGGQGGSVATGGRINAVDNALRMIKADRR